jgi:glycosyltransferase 2 family protein
MARRRALQAAGWVVSAVVLAAVVWWALRQPAPTLPRSRDDLLALGLAVVLYAGCTALRAERWRGLLRDGDARPTRGDAYRLVAVGYMGNNVLPARAGDAMRVVLMAPRANTTRRFVVGTLVAERLLDVAVLVVGFVVLASTIAGGAGLPGPTTLALLTGLALAALVALAVTVLVLRRRGLVDRARATIAPMTASTRGLRSRRGAVMLGLTVLIWLGEAAVWGACAAAAHLDASPLQALYLVALASMFSLIPSGPGYAGTQDAAAVIGVKAIGGTSAQAVSYLILVRFVLLVPITLVGLVALVARYGGVRGLRLAAASA